MVESVIKDPVKTIRYILIVAGLFVTFTNLFDCITQNTPLYQYLFYVVLIFVLTMFLVFITSNFIVAFVLGLIGVIAIYSTSPPNVASYGIVFVIFSNRIADNKVYTLSMLFVTTLTVLGNGTFSGATPVDSANVIAIYLSIFFIDYLLYNIRK